MLAESKMSSASVEDISPQSVFCPLCLETVGVKDIFVLESCECTFCFTCMQEYVQILIGEGYVTQLTCPASQCTLEGRLSKHEIKILASSDNYARYKRLLFEREVDLDPKRTFCPAAGCESVCIIESLGPPWIPSTSSDPAQIDTLPAAYTSLLEGSKKSREALPTTFSFSSLTTNKDAKLRFNEYLTSQSFSESGRATSDPVSVKCPTCSHVFCSVCKTDWHGPSISCDEADPLSFQLFLRADTSKEEEVSIKRCPECRIPIERNDGCAQMMCKRCGHCFCWYCLLSLDDDFFLRHYDKGPCKNKLGHSRVSVMVHRAQVLGIFLGFILLMLIAAPFLLLAAPCILCCKCRKCCTLSCLTPTEDPTQSGFRSTFSSIDFTSAYVQADIITTPPQVVQKRSFFGDRWRRTRYTNRSALPTSVLPSTTIPIESLALQSGDEKGDNRSPPPATPLIPRMWWTKRKPEMEATGSGKQMIVSTAVVSTASHLQLHHSGHDQIPSAHTPFVSPNFIISDDDSHCVGSSSTSGNLSIPCAIQTGETCVAMSDIL